MKIAVLGSGMVGRAISEKLLSLGHHVWMGTRDPENTRAQVKTNFAFADWLQKNPVHLVPFEEAVRSTEQLVINCTPGMISVSVLGMAGANNLEGKVLLDLANPLDFSLGMPPFLNPGNTDSLGEQIQAAFPGLRVVKSLNTMNAHLMVNPALIAGKHAVFICGNDTAAKNTVHSLLQSFGWATDSIIDLGDISASRATEQLLPVWLRLMGTLGTPMFNFGILR